ncbi:exodeoxyribonuclease VII large subunit, partial [Chitiniphilus shinanonensis]|uniref:exodeoxyribonuclease VII large subunit n=1 Tax=Chitiniphilus shinanonensis TaxID=553088 RepID=UPI0024E08FE5
GEGQRARLAQLQARLDALNPEAVLSRGYALVERQPGGVVTQAAQLRAGDALRLRFADGAVDATVTQGDGEQGALF